MKIMKTDLKRASSFRWYQNLKKSNFKFSKNPQDVFWALHRLFTEPIDMATNKAVQWDEIISQDFFLRHSPGSSVGN